MISLGTERGQKVFDRLGQLEFNHVHFDSLSCFLYIIALTHIDFYEISVSKGGVPFMCFLRMFQIVFKLIYK